MGDIVNLDAYRKRREIEHARRAAATKRRLRGGNDELGNDELGNNELGNNELAGGPRGDDSKENPPEDPSAAG